MKPTNLTPARRGVAIALLALTLLALAAPSVFAATAVAHVVPALSMTDVVYDRTRLIQFSVGAVALGMALMWWGKK